MPLERRTWPRVLLLEDDLSIAEPLVQVLAYSGFQAVHACNGMTGLRYLEGDLVPDVVLVDLVMPGMSGKTFLQIMRSMDYVRSIPVILITGAAPEMNDFPPPDSYQECFSKPFSVASLLAAIERLVTPDSAAPAGG